LKYYLKEKNEISTEQVENLIEKFADANAYMKIAVELKARSHDDLATEFAILASETPGILKGQEFNDLASCVPTNMYKSFCSTLFNNFPTLETWKLFNSEKKKPKPALTKSAPLIPESIPFIWEYRKQIAKSKKKIETFFDSFQAKDLIIEKIIEILKSEINVKEWLEMFSDLLIEYFKQYAFSLLSKSNYFYMNSFPNVYWDKLMNFSFDVQEFYEFKIRLIKIGLKDFSDKISASKPDYSKLAHWLMLKKTYFKSIEEWKLFVEKFMQRSYVSKRKLLVVAIQGILDKHMFIVRQQEQQ
jgi:hypothetical protein